MVHFKYLSIPWLQVYSLGSRIRWCLRVPQTPGETSTWDPWRPTRWGWTGRWTPRPGWAACWRLVWVTEWPGELDSWSLSGLFEPAEMATFTLGRRNLWPRRDRWESTNDLDLVQKSTMVSEYLTSILHRSHVAILCCFTSRFIVAPSGILELWSCTMYIH